MTINLGTARLPQHSRAPHALAKTTNGSRASRLGASALLVLAGLFLHLALTRSGSYISIPGLPIYVADVCLVLGALGGLVGTRFRVGSVMTLSSLIVGTFVLIQLLRVDGEPASLVLRDLAPFLYLLLIPGLAAALRDLPARSFLRFLRFATTCLAATVLLRLLHVLPPLSLGSLTEVPLFLERPDAEGCVLAVGILAWGAWPGAGTPRRLMQLSLFAIGTVNYTRAGLLAVLLGAGYALWRERRQLTAGFAIPGCLFGLAVATALLSGVAAILGLPQLAPPQAVERVLTSDVEAGTTGARIDAWRLILGHVDRGEASLTGFGPGTSPVAASGAVAYLSGSLLVRAAHSWPVTAIAYFGLVGLAVWTLVLAMIMAKARAAPLHALAAVAVASYVFASLFSVLIESPFGSAPLSVLLAWLVAQSEHAGWSVARDR